METVIQKAFIKGLEIHKPGQLGLAKKLYTSVIAIKPKHARAIYNTGII